MVYILHSALFGYWNILASHLERSAFKQRFACSTSHSMLRLQSSPYIRVWAFAAPLPLLTLLRQLATKIQILVRNAGYKSVGPSQSKRNIDRDSDQVFNRPTRSIVASHISPKVSITYDDNRFTQLIGTYIFVRFPGKS